MSSISDQVYFLIKENIDKPNEYSSYAGILKKGSRERSRILRLLIKEVDAGNIRPQKQSPDVELYCRKLLSERLRLDHRLNSVGHHRKSAKGSPDKVLRELIKFRALFSGSKEQLAIIDEEILKRKVFLESQRKNFPEELAPLVKKLTKEAS